jgi:hypothetical protein
VVSPARRSASRQVDQEALVTQILANRTRRVITPRTTVDLIHEVRNQDQEFRGEPH